MWPKEKVYRHTFLNENVLEISEISRRQSVFLLRSGIEFGNDLVANVNFLRVKR